MGASPLLVIEIRCAQTLKYSPAPISIYFNLKYSIPALRNSDQLKKRYRSIRDHFVRICDNRLGCVYLDVDCKFI